MQPAPNAPGLTAVAKLPAAEAMRLNSEGKQLYRQERWDEARAKYRAALAADPDFLGAQLNVACSFSRQGRYAEAADEAAALIRRAFVPWNREVSEAADLGILQDQDVYAKVRAARSEAALSYGKLVRDGVFFVARTKPPLSVAGRGILVLGLNQELFVWIPETGRYLQVTAEDGRVLAYAVSPTGGGWLTCWPASSCARLARPRSCAGFPARAGHPNHGAKQSRADSWRRQTRATVLLRATGSEGDGFFVDDRRAFVVGRPS
jgi:hypothetical protein